MAHAAVGTSGTFMERVNGDWHEVAMRTFMVVVLGHWRSTSSRPSRSTCSAGRCPRRAA